MQKSRLPRVIAAHDIAGYGKCALTIVLPILSACGVEVCPLPTALVSSDTSLPHFFWEDLSTRTEPILHAWDKIGLTADAVYTGFLGSAAQIQSIAALKKRFGAAMAVVDPVMGDHGRLYKTYTPAMCARMGELCAVADVATPNLTEACVLTGTPYPGEEACPALTREMAEKMEALGCRSVVITGVVRGDRLCNCLLADGVYTELDGPRHPFSMHGTGDLFASVLTGGLLTGHSLAASVSSAAAFVHFVMAESQAYQDAPRRGLCFEPHLSLLQGGLFPFCR